MSERIHHQKYRAIHFTLTRPKESWTRPLIHHSGEKQDDSTVLHPGRPYMRNPPWFWCFMPSATEAVRKSNPEDKCHIEREMTCGGGEIRTHCPRSPMVTNAQQLRCTTEQTEMLTMTVSQRRGKRILDSWGNECKHEPTRGLSVNPRDGQELFFRRTEQPGRELWDRVANR